MNNLSPTFFSSLAVICFLLSATQDLFSQDSPNILWISAEDMSPRLSMYGDNTIKTPNIERLAGEGIVYEHVYTTAGVCAPSRNAIITGSYQTYNGGHNMRTLNNTYPEQTGLPKSYSVVMPPEIKCFPEYLKAAGYYTTNNNKTDYQFEAPPTAWDEVSNKATWRNRPKGKPFFSVFNFNTTHESQIWANADKPLTIDPLKVFLPPFYPDNLVARKEIARHYANISILDNEIGALLRKLEEDGLLDKTIIFFWTDHGDGLPFFKREIYRRGLHVPLIVRFPDGKKAGSRDSRWISSIDFAPTVLSLAGIKPPGKLAGKAFLGKYASKKGRDMVFAARDRLDSHYDRVRTVLAPKYQYIRNYYPELPRYMDLEYRKQQPLMRDLLKLKGEGKLTGFQNLWFEKTKPSEELYNWEHDPYELVNLAQDPKYLNILVKMRKQLDKWQQDYPDKGSIPEKELIASWWQGKNQPPVTAPPIIIRKAGKLQISCSTNDASIGWRQRGEKSWNVYTGPFKNPHQKIECVAMRIGYVSSDLVTH
jgi:arylsulfatase A-like enzyme